MHGVSFKKRAPRAIKEIRKFATVAMVREIILLLSPVFLSFEFTPTFVKVGCLRLHGLTPKKLLPVYGENREPKTSASTHN